MRQLVPAAVLVAICLSRFPARADDPAPVFSDLHGADLDGELHHLRVTDNERAVVVVFLSTTCPISNGYIPALNRLAKQYARGIDVYGVVSSSSTTRARAIEHRAEFEPAFPVLFDASGALLAELQPTHTPHAFVLGADGRIVYSGAIDDRYAAVGRSKLRATRHYLREAVTATLASRPVVTPSTKPIGCRIEKPPAARPTTDVTYNRDIAPIVRSHCAACHREGQRAPFPLLCYDDVSRHARQIVDVTRSRLMPPWKPTRGHGEFRNERRLSDREIHLLSVWERNGKPRGDDGDELPEPEYATGWQLGRPDVVLTMKREFEIPADGPDLWQHFVFRSIVPEDRLIAAVEFRPGATESVHHASFFIDSNYVGRKLDALEPDYGYRAPGGGPLFRPNGVLRSWFPGAHPYPLPDGIGRPLPKGSDLVVEIHYHPVGRVLHDRSQIGIHFAPRNARQFAEEIQVTNAALDIPAGAKQHRHTASMTVPVDITLLDTSPHMHLLGKSVEATATTPDGESVPLVRVDDWDFNWQGHYVYREPIRLPAGSRIDVAFEYDNSAENPLNPFSPPQRITWGDSTVDEMAICHFQFTCDTLPEFTRMVRHNEAVVGREYESVTQGRPPTLFDELIRTPE